MNLLPLLLILGAPARAQQASTPAAAAIEPGRLIDLNEAYRLTLARSETLAESSEAVVAAMARVDELESDIFPHVSLIASETFQQNPKSGIAALDKSAYPLAQITAVQPIFSGFREYLAFKQGKALARSALHTEDRARTLLYQSVAQAYLNLLLVQSEAAIQRDVIELTGNRIRQLADWVKIGRSRQSDLLAARTQLAQDEAQLEITRGAERAAQETLMFLTGLDERLAPQPLPLPALEPIDGFLARAAHRHDVEAAKDSMQAASLGRSLVARQRWGSVVLTGDYYLKRIGFSQKTHYDAILGLNLPLFDFGTISSQTRQADAVERAQAQALSLARRQAAYEVRAAYRNLEWTLAAARALDGAADLAGQNVKAQSEDYRLGLVTNLDVLSSLTNLQATRLSLDQTTQQAVLARIQLEVAAGGPVLP